jgi:hypothetical protein
MKELHAVGVFSISSIGWAPRGFDIGCSIGFRAQTTQKCRWVKSAGADLKIVALVDDAPFFFPELSKAMDDLLEGQHGFLPEKNCISVYFMTASVFFKALNSPLQLFRAEGLEIFVL